MIIIALIYNLSVLVAISVLSGFIDARSKRTERSGKILQGLLFGITAVIGMLYPFVLTTGIIFDGRSIVISLCTLFFGPVSGAIAAFIALLYRVNLGGGGALMGSLVIISSFLIGLYFNLNREKIFKKRMTKLHLYLFGLIVHISMLIFVLSLPSKNIVETYKIITTTVLGIYPIVTIIIGKILLDQEENQNFIKKLAESEKLFRTTLYSIGDAVIITDTRSRIIQMNFMAEELTGWKSEEANGKQIEDVLNLIYEKTKRKLEYLVDEVIQKGIIKEFSNHVILVSKNKKEFPISDSCAPIKNETGEITGVVIVFRDISDRKRREDELLILSQVFKQSPASIMITSTKGEVEFVNPKFTEITGFAPEEIIGKNPRVIQGPEQNNLNKFDEIEKKVIDGNEWRGEVLNRKSDNSTFWVSASISPIKNQEGEITHYLSVKEDITAKKEMEFELKRALDRSEESDRLKSSLLANMSHEFRTPMTGILGLASILKEIPDEDVKQEMLDGIITSGKRLMNTLDAVLDIAELQSEFYSKEKDIINISDITNKAALEFHEKARLKELEFVFINNAGSLFVNSNFKNLWHVLSHLLDNAIKFTQKGSVSFSIEPEETEDAFFVKIKIADTGIGIPEKYLNIIFDEFRQVSEGLSRSHEGSGLGLSLVKKIVNLLDGEICVESVEGKGSVFIVYLPALKFIPEADPENKKNIETKTIIAEANNSVPSILLVEDNEINQKVTRNYLKTICEIDCVSNGLAAIDAAAKKKYSVLLMDINLGHGIDGVETTKEIRKIEGYVDIPVVALTGYTMGPDKEKLLSSGLDYFLAKPFERSEISELVKRILKNAGYINF